LFEGPSSGERPNKGSLSLDRDLRGGIGEGLEGYIEGMRSELNVERASRSGRRRRELRRMRDWLMSFLESHMWPITVNFHNKFPLAIVSGSREQ
jgi:hypothetical protein